MFKTLVENFKILMAMLFSALFLILALSMGVLAAYQFVTVDYQDADTLVSGIIRAINTAVISLATFELGIGIGKEYAISEEGQSLLSVVRRTVTRFISVVAISLALEGLIMVIKYSQLDLAGNLFYPVAIIASASLLLMALGVFLFLTRPLPPNPYLSALHRPSAAASENPTL